MRQILATAAICLLRGHTAVAAPFPNAQDLTVDLGYSVYRGVRESATGLNVWRGIRYAAPPTGDLRWRAPSAPAVSRDGTVNATAFAPACPQGVPAPFGPAASTFGNEDCLFLNVYAPPLVDGCKLPVLVHIHGGGYGAGSGEQDMSELLGANNNGFVVISIQYRLGAFGFLSSAEVEADGDLNAGILDMAFALQWVQDHSSQFGGDASQVTISGQSAGAGGVMLLSIAKNGTLGTSLFSGILAASPYLPTQHEYNASLPTQRYQSFAARAGCGNSTDTLACLRSQDSAMLQTANVDENEDYLYGNWAFIPVTEPSTGFIVSRPSEALAAKRVNGAHALVGNNADEGPAFVPPAIENTTALQSWLKDVYPGLTAADLATILSAYPPSTNMSSTPTFATTGLGPATALDTSPFGSGIQQRAYNMYGEATFVCPSYWLSNAFSSASQNRSSFHYQYSVPAGLHGADLTAYFGPATPNQPVQFTTAFRRIWGAFVTGASPDAAVVDTNTDARRAWPQWRDEGETSSMLNLNTTGGVPYQSGMLVWSNLTQYMEPGVQNDFSVVDALAWEGGRGTRCDMWKSIGERVPL